MLLHFTISSARRSLLGFDEELSVDFDEELSVDFDEELSVDLDVDSDGASFPLAFGDFPSARALLTASTSSLFSKKDFVEIPYDFNSFVRSPAFMLPTSGRAEEETLSCVNVLPDVARCVKCGANPCTFISSAASAMRDIGQCFIVFVVVLVS